MSHKFLVNLYSHGCFITCEYDNDVRALTDYCRTISQFENVWVRHLRRKVKQAVAIYACTSMDRMTYGFVLGELPYIKQYLMSQGYIATDFKEVVHTPDPGVPIDISLCPGVAPRDEEQRKVLEFLTEKDKHQRVLSLRTGGGKAQPLHSKIKTPTGWVAMGSIAVDDEVTAWDGTTSKVIGVYPQGIRDVYRVTFKDGRVVEADGDHLWLVCRSRYRQYESDSRKIYPWENITTMGIKHLLENNDGVLSIPLIIPPSTDDLDLPLDPYLLGVILGDGSISSSSCVITKNDKFIFDEIKPHAEAVGSELIDASNKGCMAYRLTGSNGSIITILRTLGLMGCRSHEKFIPPSYLNASFNQKLSLIQGLFDTDGTVGSHATISYSTSSYQLAMDVQYLVRSIGGICHIGIKIPTYVYNGEKLNGKLSYRLNVRLKSPDTAFRLPRKKTLLRHVNQYTNSLRLQIKSVDYVGKMYTQCIAIDHPDHLYITDDFTVTHNTALALMTSAHFGTRTALVMSSGYLDIWRKSISWVLGLTQEDYYIAQGTPKLKKIIDLSLAGRNNYKLIFITIGTLRSYINEYLSTGVSSIGVAPIDLYSVLGVGLRIVDEAHETPHALTIQTIHTHVAKSIYLSATLEATDPFINNRYKMLFKDNDRFKQGSNNRHVEVFSAYYSLEYPNDATYMGEKGYSHVAYENWMLTKKHILHRYFDLVYSLVKSLYIDVRKPGEKALIFCSTVEFCRQMTEWLARQPGLKDVSLSYYVAFHEVEVLHSHDIVVTTPTSAGTGKDIKGLVFCLSTVAIGSVQRNLQMLGRIRDNPNDPDFKPRYVYLTCRNIQKHMYYDYLKRSQQFVGRCKRVAGIETHRLI